MAKSTWLKIGVVGKAHGLRGAFFVSGRNEPIPSEIEQVVIGEVPERGYETKILQRKMQGGRPVLTLAGASSREELEPFKGKPIWVRRSDLKLAADEYCWADLIGVTVLDSEGVSLGVVKSVDNQGASDFVVVQGPDKRELAIPLVRAYFDMDFSSESTSLKLTVSRETFAEAWQEP